MYGLGNAKQFQSVIQGIYERGETGLSELKGLVNQPGYQKKLRTYKSPEMLAQTCLSRSTFRRYVSKGQIKLNGYDVDTLLNKKEYTLEDIYAIREQVGKGFWGGLPSPNKKKAITISISMFKGGVGKTTQATHLASAAAISGLKHFLLTVITKGLRLSPSDLYPD